VIVVADAGPLIHLGGIGRLDLIRCLAPEVLVPRSVFHEVTVVGRGLPGAAEVAAATWITVVSPAGSELANALLSSGLHRGEAEAIALAVERKAQWLLIDERQGRLVADAMGLTIVGSVGVVIAAKARGELPVVAPVLDELRASGLWLSESFLARVLAACGERRDS
jgi:uncharacterized protein